MHDLLLAKGGIALPQSHGLRQSVERHRGRLSSELTLARLRRKAPTLEALREQVDRAAAGEEAEYPRWVRVNALRSSVEEQLETTFAKFDRAASLQDVMASNSRGTGEAKKCVYVDEHVPGLLAVTQGTELTKTEAYTSGKIILQDKASCFPAYLLDPRCEDGDVIDACAAPGNKTTHLAAILHTHAPEFASPAQTIFAFEKDAARARTLEKMVKTAGARGVTRIGPGQDFLQVDPRADKYKDVGALLLDPSCSGSGIVGRDSMPELHLPELLDTANKKTGQTMTTNKKKKKKKGPTPSTEDAQKHDSNPRKRKHADVEDASDKILRDDEGNETVVTSEKDLQARLDALSGFQLALLLHAFEFPAARKVTYSTCSVHAEENESVVMLALASDIARRRGWRILRREEQVTGMREWPVRGVAAACGGDGDVAEGCIRSYKGDGRGVMGFFVAGFVRTGEDDGDDDDADHDGAQDGTGDVGEGPYVRDEDGVIVRDVAGMPVLKSTGLPVSLEPREADESDGSHASSSETSDGSEEDNNDGGDTDDEDEWNGFGD